MSDSRDAPRTRRRPRGPADASTRVRPYRRPITGLPAELGMEMSFLAAKPLQAVKLAASGLAAALGLAALLGAFGSSGQVAILMAAPFVGLPFAPVVAAEGGYALYRWTRTGDSVGAALARRPGYALVRGVELVAAVGGAGFVVLAFGTLASGRLSGPGAIGLAFVTGAASLVTLAAVLCRCLVDLYLARANRTGGGTDGAPAHG